MSPWSSSSLLVGVRSRARSRFDFSRAVHRRYAARYGLAGIPASLSRLRLGATGANRNRPALSARHSPAPRRSSPTSLFHSRSRDFLFCSVLRCIYRGRCAYAEKKNSASRQVRVVERGGRVERSERRFDGSWFSPRAACETTKSVFRQGGIAGWIADENHGRRSDARGRETARAARRPEHDQSCQRGRIPDRAEGEAGRTELK